MLRTQVKSGSAVTGLAVLLVALLAGCGSSEVSLSGEGLEVNPGQSTAAAVLLDPPASASTSVELFLLASPAESFLAPESVTVPRGESGAVFSVTALENALAGDRIEITIVEKIGLARAGRYTVGSPSRLVVEVVAAPLPEVALVGPDLVVAPGEGFTYSVQRSLCAEAISVPLLVSGNSDCFTTPSSVGLSAGACARSFQGSASTDSDCADRFIDAAILAPEGYVLGDSTTTRITIEPEPAVPPLDLPEVNLIGPDSTLAPGGSTTLAVRLSEPATESITVNILLTGNVDQFTGPSSIVVPAGSRSVSFDVTADGMATSGAEVQVTLDGGAGYSAGSGSPVLRVAP